MVSLIMTPGSLDYLRGEKSIKRKDSKLEFACDICGVKFQSVRAMEIHKFKVHGHIIWEAEGDNENAV